MKPVKNMLRAGYLIAAIITMVISCKKETNFDNALLSSDNEITLGRKGGGQPSTETGNNLSFPVIWSENVPITLRVPPGGIPKINGAWWYVWGAEPVDPNSTIYSCNPAISDPCYPAGTPDVFKAYLQKDTGNIWQAFNAPANSIVNVDLVDWGDNLESMDWSITSKVRTEVVLYENLPSPSLSTATVPVLEYAMRHVSGWGTDELHGLKTDLQNQIQYGPGTQATVYSPLARLSIQQLTTATPNLTWNPTTHSWSGDVKLPVVNQGFAGEVNVKGKIIFGYTWDVRKFSTGVGTYRVTFSFDYVPNLNTYFDSNSQVLVPIETIVPAAETGGGGTAVIDVANNLTYIDVVIKGTGQGGGGGGKGKNNK